MFHNYFFLKRLASSLDDRLKNLSLVECFSQNKDELILAFADKENEFYVRANLDPVISLLQFPETFARAGRNSVDLFKSLINQKVLRVEAYKFERSFYIQFETGDSLIFKMHARRANILQVRGNKVIHLFRKKLSQDLDIIPFELNQDVEISESNFKDHNHDPHSLIPALGKEVKISLEKDGFVDLSENDKWQEFSEKLSKLESNPIFLIESNLPRISLVETSDFFTEDPIAAANWLYEKSARKLFFEKEKDQLINGLKQKIKKSENYISKNTQKLSEIEASRNPEEIANILMANLHKIQTGLSKVVLTDIYTEAPITIKLNTALTPQKNAENYYRRSKNRHQEIDALKKNIKEKEQLIDDLSKQILEIQDLETNKEVRKFKKSKGLKRGKNQKQEIPPYHLFELEDWQIMVGKNSKSNDELTLKVANKNDLWLHAKDVPGSHVVIREKPGQNFPNHIIEFAASLAAANSKRKTDTLCPVIYTPKKFVRKVKGALAGQVIVEKEEIVMIEPHSEPSY